MQIILNELEYAEQCLKSNNIDQNPYFTISLLAKYYYHHMGYRKKRIVELLTEFMKTRSTVYSASKSYWDEKIDKIASNAGKYPLVEIDGVWITKAELDKIAELKNKMVERLAFTILCLAKFLNTKNANNNNLVSLPLKDIFALARTSGSMVDKLMRMSVLYNNGFVEISSNNDGISLRITYTNESSDRVLFISDFRELGYEYMKYLGENFIRCRECGLLVRNNKSRTRRYCKEHSAYKPMKIKNITCVDCGTTFFVKSKASRTCRCETCQRIKRRGDNRARVNRMRAASKNANYTE